jgi:lysophospholipase L1-like esterase
MPASAAISEINGVAVEWANCGWSGADPSQIMAFGVDTLQYFSPDILVLPNGSPNVSAAPITASGITSSRQMLYRLLAECQIKGVRPLIWTWLPTNDTTKAWNSSDSLRRAWNDDTRRLATQRGLLVLDADAVLAGVDNGAGQIQMLAGSNSDGIHPNDTGNALLAAEFKKAFAILSQ